MADESASSLASLNKTLPSPLQTKSEEKRSAYSPGYASKYSTRTPPKDLSEMVNKVKDESNDENYCLVRTPNVSVPANNLLGMIKKTLARKVIICFHFRSRCNNFAIWTSCSST